MCLHRVAEEVVEWSQCRIQPPVITADRCRRINIGRGAKAVGNFTKVHTLAAQGAINIGKRMHPAKMGMFFPSVNRAAEKIRRP